LPAGMDNSWPLGVLNRTVPPRFLISPAATLFRSPSRITVIGVVRNAGFFSAWSMYCATLLSNRAPGEEVAGGAAEAEVQEARQANSHNGIESFLNAADR